MIRTAKNYGMSATDLEKNEMRSDKTREPRLSVQDNARISNSERASLYSSADHERWSERGLDIFFFRVLKKKKK